MKTIHMLTLLLPILFGCSTPSATPRQSDGTYLCSDCNLKYTDQAIAKKCYDWCTTQHSCNVAITQHAVGK